MLKSILNQLEFSHTIRDFDDKAVPFRTHLHIPEAYCDSGT